MGEGGQGNDEGVRATICACMQGHMHGCAQSSLDRGHGGVKKDAPSQQPC